MSDSLIFFDFIFIFFIFSHSEFSFLFHIYLFIHLYCRDLFGTAVMTTSECVNIKENQKKHARITLEFWPKKLKTKFLYAAQMHTSQSAENI